ncbi:MoaF C-terminal domain-containing protein [Nonomuraea sediminis]|uniref:MoaF C-terminal domain-containing protein n=1 Tax=Nonomuraea sediminis TaxID=2835864 RepID=UPI001BDDC8B5|nr:MoaF C-terminal domain-containing protein [Nonomuraea sediminis]
MNDRPAGWKNMDDFARGIATNRLPASDVLAGTELKLRFDDGTATTLSFATGAQVHVDGGPAGWYEAIAVRDDLIFVGLAPRGRELTVVVLHQGRALRVVSAIAPEPTPGRPRVSQEFTPGVMEGVPVSAEPPAPTRELIGRRALYRYSPEHLYEHVYLSSERYAWQCLVGEQRGHGDVDLATAWKIAEDVYVFTFREFLIPVAATWLYDWAALRTVGTFFGLTGDGEISADPGGAHIIPLGKVSYPNEEPI